MFSKVKEDDSDKTGILGSLLGIGSSLFNNKNNQDVNNTDEVDKAGDHRDVLPLGEGYGLFRRDSSGNVQPDTSDSNTKSLLEKLQIKERLTTKLQEAQLKAAEIITTNFDTSKMKESKGGKLGWLSMLLMGGLLWKSGVLQKVFDGVVKPIWTDHVKPWITNTAVPWIDDKWNNKVKPFLTDTVGPWILNTVIPLIPL